MNNQDLTVFNNTELGYQLRMAGSVDKPLFCLKDVCDNLGIKQPTRVAKRLSEEDMRWIKITSGGQVREMLFITEPALYEVLATTNKEAGKKFRNDLCYKVLPKLRKLAIPKIKTAKQSDLKEVKMLEILKEIFNMNNQDLTVFNNTEFNCSIRSLTIDGEQHWAGIDVAKYLGLKSPSVAITELIPAKYKKEIVLDTPRRPSEKDVGEIPNNLKTKIMFINKAGILSFIMNSKKLNSQAKTEWLIEKVLNNTPQLTDAQFDKLLKARVEKARAEHLKELDKKEVSNIDWFETFTNRRTGDELRYYHFDGNTKRDLFVFEDVAKIFRLNANACWKVGTKNLIELDGETPLAHKNEVRLKGITPEGLDWVCQKVKSEYKRGTKVIVNYWGRFLKKKLNQKIGWILEVQNKVKQIKPILEVNEITKLEAEVKKLKLIKEKKVLTMEIKALDKVGIETAPTDINLINRLKNR